MTFPTDEDQESFGFETGPSEPEILEEVAEEGEWKDPTVVLDEFMIINSSDHYDTVNLFSYAIARGASDIHLLPDSPPRLRIKGDLIPVEELRPLVFEDIDIIRQETMSPQDQGQYVARIYSHVYAYEIPLVGRYRLIISKVLGGLSIVARLLVDTPPSFDELNTKPAIRDLANFSSGLILVAGVVGSGKSTLMAAMIQYINANSYKSIISLEDPIEIVHKPNKSSILQRSLGADMDSFAEGVIDAMRQDPNVLLIGEIRDLETARAALKAALTGQLVISTVHAMNATAAITYMVDLLGSTTDGQSERNKLGEVLRGIVCQKLVKTQDGNRTAVNEVLLNTPEMKRALEENREPTELRALLEESREIGMQTYEDHLYELYLEGAITEKVCLAQAVDIDKMKGYLAEASPAEITLEDVSIVEPADPSPSFSFPATPPATFPAAAQPAESRLPSKPAKSFSEMIKESDDEKGNVSHRSGEAPQRPNVYRPRSR